MGKPILLTDEIREEILRQYREALFQDCRSSDDVEQLRVDPELLDEYLDKTCTLHFTTAAYCKMYLLVHFFDTEVAWHGVCRRTDTGFEVTDILVMPQTVTGGHVDTDQTEYEKWLFGFRDDVFNHIRMHGHSHVNFPTFASGTDTAHQQSIAEKMEPDDYYIFLILNKKGEVYVRILDNANNTEYRTESVELTAGDGGDDLLEFLDEADTAVRPYVPPKYPVSRGALDALRDSAAEDYYERQQKLLDEYE